MRRAERHTPELQALQRSLPSFGSPPLSPLLKWAGGKGQLQAIIRKAVPNEFQRYVEPFLGGGALFWNLALPNSIVSDTNFDLIQFYSVVRDMPEELIEAVRPMPISEEDFYRIRSQEPGSLSPVERAARFIYLNKTCFNGLYRVNRRGQFNTPFAKITHVKILDEAKVGAASRLLSSTTLLCSDYSSVLADLKSGDFVYLDPPYVPLGGYSDFRRYTADRFEDKDHIRLAEDFRRLSERGIQALMSNSCTEQVEALYSDWWKVRIPANRQINCRSERRGKIKEFLIANYPLHANSILP